jgi:hypothetical protein
MRLFPITAALVVALSTSTIAAAQPASGAAPPAKVQSGERIYSSDGAVIGRVEYLDKGKDGVLKDVGVIYDMRIVHIPADTLSPGPNGVTTSLKRSDVGKLD